MENQFRLAKRLASTVVRDRELKHLAQADRYISEVNKRIARQRALVEAAKEKGRLRRLRRERVGAAGQVRPSNRRRRV